MDWFMDSADPTKKVRSNEIRAELTTAQERVYKLTQGRVRPSSTRAVPSSDISVACSVRPCPCERRRIVVETDRLGAPL